MTAAPAGSAPRHAPVLQVSQPEELGDDYLRYLMNRLRDDFGLPGVPTRLTMRKPKNPFAGRSTRP